MIYILGGFNFRNPQLFSWIEERPSQQIERNEGTKGMTNQRPLNIWTEHSNCRIHSRGDSKTLIAILILNIFMIFFMKLFFYACKS